ncbi:MAG TPA: hypothetical protein PLC53_02075 [Bacilli bacterium]|nr:hypothetical protein [Bacilli bacterium]
MSDFIKLNNKYYRLPSNQVIRKTLFELADSLVQKNNDIMIDTVISDGVENKDRYIDFKNYIILSGVTTIPYTNPIFKCNAEFETLSEDGQVIKSFTQIIPMSIFDLIKLDITTNDLNYNLIKNLSFTIVGLKTRDTYAMDRGMTSNRNSSYRDGLRLKKITIESNTHLYAETIPINYVANPPANRLAVTNPIVSFPSNYMSETVLPSEVVKICELDINKGGTDSMCFNVIFNLLMDCILRVNDMTETNALLDNNK